MLSFAHDPAYPSNTLQISYLIFGNYISKQLRKTMMILLGGRRVSGAAILGYPRFTWILLHNLYKF